MSELKKYFGEVRQGFGYWLEEITPFRIACTALFYVALIAITTAVVWRYR